MKTYVKIILILISIGLIVAVGTYLYVFHKPHRNINKEKPAYIMNAEDLYSEFAADEKTGYEKYGNQVVEVTGKVAAIAIQESFASLTLIDEMEGINCSFDSMSVIKYQEKLSKINVGDTVCLKGQCDGFDMIMGVVLTRCVFPEKK